jgi:hypothetical protein
MEELSVTDDLDWSPEDGVAFGKLADRRADSGAGALVHRYRLRHRAVRRVRGGGDGRPAAVDGVAGVDTAWLRGQLDMPSDLAG